MSARNLLLLAVCLCVVDADEFDVKQEIRAMAEQIEILKTLHLTEVTHLKRDIEDLRAKSSRRPASHEHNEQSALHWAQASVKELRTEMKEMSRSLNNSVLLRQLQTIRNELKQALVETADLAKLSRTQDSRIDKLESLTSRMQHDVQQMRNAVAELRIDIGKINKEVQSKQFEDDSTSNDVLPEDNRLSELKYTHATKYRHSKMIHRQISRLAQTQEQLDVYQQNLQTQVLDAQRRLDRLEEPNWNLLSAKVDLLELESKSVQNRIKNMTQKVSDFDKIHSSMLELREDLEGIENKADKTIPEFRKEISKLDVSFAKLNAQASYLKENQENLRQSVKAIAVSVSNSIDRAEVDRLTLNHLNEYVEDLQARSRQHYNKLNDHIFKSEANPEDLNMTDIVALPEIMGEIKELEPVEREYEDLVKQLPRDCSGVDAAPGVYLIHPGNRPIDAWCANGTTFIQRRYNGTIEFNRKYNEYVKGFGNPASEYWLGLEVMHLLSKDNCSSMRIDMQDIYGGSWYAKYEHFRVGHADTGYILDVGGFEGNASDAFDYQNHMEFSAIDHDRDISNTHCAGNYEGGWWYSHCQHVNINGKYSLGLTWFDSTRNEWIAVASSEMKFYRRPGCS